MELGKVNRLSIVKTVEFGVYLATQGSRKEEERVLLPKKEVKSEWKLGDEIEVFLYRDSSDRMIATTRTPKVTLGKVARLKVAQTGKVGAFLDWGLEKDLLLPFKEQTYHVEAGHECLVALYIDKSNRLCATMKLYPYLENGSSYKKEDNVTGLLYEISENFGAFVAVDDRYSALIPKKEFFHNAKTGDTVSARVISVTDDGRLTLALRKKAYLQMEDDANAVRKLIAQYDGVLPFNDKASPELIMREAKMSKNEFKRAVGHLLKNGEIEIGENSIRLIQK